SDPLTLGVPGTLTVRAADGLPFTARVAGATPVDETRVQRLPDGLAAAGWSRDGELSMALEPGTYELVVHRGPRYELHQQSITVAAGETLTVDVSLPAAFDTTGWILGDPHSHASPSSDGGIPMEERLVVTGAVGIQVHFGTDHDHLADYRPLLAPLGLEGVVKSVVSDEVSPPLRGHFNIYPVEPTPGAPDNGAWTWWTEIPETTEQMVDTLRERHGDGFVLQSNHPLSSGLASSAGWSPGSIGTPEKWTERFEAVEVLNSGSEEHLEFWVDVVSRGLRVTPIGVSDSHDHFGGSVGWSATWFAIDGPVTSVTDEALVDAIRSGHVTPSRGPLLVTDPLPGETVQPGATISVESRSASWVGVDRLRLLRDGVEIEVVTGTQATFTLDPEVDAWYAVIAEGDAPMTPVTSRTPWALAGPWRVDVGADGWTAPAPAFVVR
ncbi:MAG: CehA/McbA family metallohydrolase, partial [Myxococcota bacterium]